MDESRFDAMTRTISLTPSRRSALRLLANSALAGMLAPWFGHVASEAHDKLRKCKKIEDKDKRRRCKKKAKQHNASHDTPPPCNPTSCAAQGQTCGNLADGCGSTLACGTCTDPQICGEGTCCLPDGEVCAGSTDDASCCGLCNDDINRCGPCITNGGHDCTGTVGQPNPGPRPCCANHTCTPGGEGTTCFQN